MLNKYLYKLEIREFRLIAMGVLLLIGALIASYAIAPQLKKVNAAKSQLNAIQTLPPTMDVSAQIEEMHSMVNGLRKSLHGDTGALPERELEAFLIGRLQSISWSNSIELASVRPASRKRIKDFWETTFEIQVNGDYQSVFNWLQAIRDQLGFIVIKEFQLVPKNRNEQEPSLAASMIIASYQGEP